MKLELVLRDRLREHGVRALTDHVEQQGEAWRSAVIEECIDRFDAKLQKRLAETEARLSERIISTRVELLKKIGDMRVEVLRWTLGFWVGQAIVISGAVFVLLELVNR